MFPTPPLPPFPPLFLLSSLPLLVPASMCCISGSSSSVATPAGAMEWKYSLFFFNIIIFSRRFSTFSQKKLSTHSQSFLLLLPLLFSSHTLASQHRPTSVTRRSPSVVFSP